MDCRFSVIIPVYNAENSLQRCVDSILLQAPLDLELLLINDGSTDSSGRICESYAAKDSRVRYYLKENGGVSSARNMGLDAARGEYVLFVDSDDCVAPELFSQIDSLLRERSWDWIRFAIAPVGTPPAAPAAVKQQAYPTRDALFPRIIDDICSKAINSPCAKLYRREILEREALRFPLGASVAEDRALNIRYSMSVQSFLVSSQVVYYVNTSNPQSLSRKKHKDLSAQFAITGNYVLRSIREAPLPETEKDLYLKAYHFGICRGIYKYAKDLHGDRVRWFRRQKLLWNQCRQIRQMHMSYPNTSYCRKITLPVTLYQTWLIDLIAKYLVHQ